MGASAIASDIAVGDYARANIAIGNKVEGLNSLPSNATIEEIEGLIKSEYPKIKDWIINLINLFVQNMGIG